MGCELLTKRFVFLSLILFFSPILFIWQGLDFTDMGFNLVSARDMILDPGNGAGYEAFLSMFLGGLWGKVSSSWGLLGARFGVVLVYWAIFAASYVVLKDFLSPSRTVIALFATFLFTQRTSWISYNDITALFACLALVALYLGHKSKKGHLYVLSGALCSLAFFARVPNIMMAGFGFLPLIVHVLFDHNLKDRMIWKSTSLFYLGYIGTFLFVCVFMVFGGYWEAYYESLARLFSMSSSDNRLYSSESLFRRLIEDHKRVLSLGVVLFFSGTGVGYFLRFRRVFAYFVVPSLTIFSLYIGWNYYRSPFLISPVLFWLALVGFLLKASMLLKKEHPESAFDGFKHQKIVWVSCLLISLAVLSTSISYLYHNPRSSVYDPVFGLVYIVSTIALVRAWRQDDRMQFFALLAGISMMLTVPLGSGNGIRNAIHGLWFALPLTLKVIQEIQFKNLRGLRHCIKTDAPFIKLGVILLLAMSVAISYRYTYRDSNDRFEMKFTVDHPKLRGIFTTKERAKVVQEVLDELGKYVKPGDFLLGYHTVSTLYFLTETRPYLYNSWPFLYEPDLLRHYLEKAQKERPEDPVVVRSKYSLQNFEWPKRNFMNRTTQYKENIKTIEEFLERKRYQKVWENGVFEILIPPKNV